MHCPSSSAGLERGAYKQHVTLRQGREFDPPLGHISPYGDSLGFIQQTSYRQVSNLRPPL